eukprot:1317233-Amorphochlora_amoeboformis.AAC.1
MGRIYLSYYQHKRRETAHNHLFPPAHTYQALEAKKMRYYSEKKMYPTIQTPPLLALAPKNALKYSEQCSRNLGRGLGVENCMIRGGKRNAS